MVPWILRTKKAQLEIVLAYQKLNEPRKATAFNGGDDFTMPCYSVGNW